MKIKHLVIGIGACAICVANFVFGVKTPSTSTDLTIQNIEAVGLTAGETVCKATDDDDCFLYDKNGMIVGKSKAPLVRYD